MDQTAPGLLSAGMKLPVADHVLDLGREVLLDAQARVVELRPQAYQVLRHLALHAGRVVTKEELLATVWPGLVVTDDSLVQAVGDVRRALGAHGHEIVKTVPRRGYMLLAAAASLTAPGGVAAGPAPRRASRTGVWVGVAFAVAALALAGWIGFGQRGVDPRAGDTASIAVLPFKDPQGDVDAQLLARGLAEDLVAELARAPGWRVVSHQSSFQLDAGQLPLAQIGRQLRSRYLVDGTVRREGERLRLTVDLLDSEDGRVVWSSAQTVDRLSLAGVQAAFVGRIAGSLQVKVRTTEESRALSQPPKSLDAYVLTQHGKSMMQRYSPQGMRDARRLLGQALVADPDHAPAWVFLGMTNTIDAGLNLTGDWHRGRMNEVLAQVERAVALAPDLPVAYVALSQAQALAGNHEGALASAERCVQLSANDAECFYILGKAQLDLGQAEPAVRHLAEALDRNPMPPAYLPAFHATALWASRRYDEAIRVADDCLLRAPDFWRCRQDRIAALVELGRLPEARKEAEALTARMPRMTAAAFGRVFAPGATALRERRIAAALAAGMPATANP